MPSLPHRQPASPSRSPRWRCSCSASHPSAGQMLMDALHRIGSSVVHRVPARRDHRARVHQLRLAHASRGPWQPAAGRPRDAGLLPRRDTANTSQHRLAVHHPEMELDETPGVPRRRSALAGLLFVGLHCASRVLVASATLPFAGPAAAERFGWVLSLTPVLLIVLRPQVLFAVARPAVLDASPSAARPPVYPRQRPRRRPAATCWSPGWASGCHCSRSPARFRLTRAGSPGLAISAYRLTS